MTYEYTDQNGDTLNILPGVDDGNVWVEVGHHETGWVMSVAHDDAPAAALAILELAGYDNANHGPGYVARILRVEVEAIERKAEREAEDAKVREFFEGQHDTAGIVRSSWVSLPDDIQEVWRKRYRAARELFRES